MNDSFPQYAYLGLGSNIGDREKNLVEARARTERLGLRVAAASSIYETEPVGYSAQPWFLNQVLKVEVEPDSRYYNNPSALLIDLLDIESQMGRERTTRLGPRTIDIDLLLQDGIVENFQVELSGKMGTGEGGAIRPEGAPVEASTSEEFDRGKHARTADLILPHPRLHLRRFVLEPLCEIDPDLAHPVSSLTCREMLLRLPTSGPVVSRT